MHLTEHAWHQWRDLILNDSFAVCRVMIQATHDAHKHAKRVNRDPPRPNRHLRGAGRLLPPPSRDRRDEGSFKFNTFSYLARRGITHVIHLFKEFLSPPPYSTPLSLISYDDFLNLEIVQDLSHIPTFPSNNEITREDFERVVGSVPYAWYTTISRLNFQNLDAPDLITHLILQGNAPRWLATLDDLAVEMTPQSPEPLSERITLHMSSA